MSSPTDGDAANGTDHDQSSPSNRRPGPYPGALDARLLTPRAPLPPGAGIGVFPPIIDPAAFGTGAAWAPDPSGRHQWRWWNGVIWTDHVADDGEQSEDPLAPDP